MLLPPGFRFRPFDEELIIQYLLKKVRGEELPWEGIHEFDIYGDKAPWEIFDDIVYGQEEEKHYLFTRLKKINKRVTRTAGCGTWHENSCNQIYDDQGQHVIGLNKQFCFKVKQESRMKKSKWIMHEFSLAGVLLEQYCTTWVLCTVNKKGPVTKGGVKRCFEDVHVPHTIISTSVEAPTPCLESPQLLLGDGTQLRKRMRCDVQSDLLQASEIPLSLGSSQSEVTLSPNSVDFGEDNTETTDLETQMGCIATNDTADSEFYASELGMFASESLLPQNFVDSGEDMGNNTQTTDLETHMGCLPSDDNINNADSDFCALYGYLPPPSTPEREHLPLDTWKDFCNDEFFRSVFA